MNPDFETILEECLACLRAGDSLEQCLSSYPAQAERLTPLLLAASRVRQLASPQPRVQAVLAGRERVLAAMQAKNPAQAVFQSPVSVGRLSRYLGRIVTVFQTNIPGKEKPMKFALRLAIDLVVMSLIGGVLAVTASSNTLPGDPLYTVKRAWETTRLTLTLDPQANQDLQAQLNAERLHEVQNLIQLHRAATVEFEAGLQAMNASMWTVGNIPVEIQPNTVVEGTPQVGQMVWVQAQVQTSGALTAVSMRMVPQNQDGVPVVPPMKTRTSAPLGTRQAPGMMNTQRAPGMATTQAAPGMMNTQGAPTMMTTQTAPRMMNSQTAPATRNTQVAPSMKDTQGAPSMMNPTRGPGSGPGMGPGKRP